MSAIRQSLNPTKESRLTKIGVWAWCAVFAIAAGRAVWNDHIAYMSANTSLKEKNESLNSKLSAKPSVVTKQVVLPPPIAARDPFLMTPESFITMIGTIRRSIEDQVPIAFLVSGSDENTRIKNLTQAFLLEICNSSDRLHNGRLACTVKSQTPETPVTTRQGMLLHVNQQIGVVNKTALVNSLSDSLSQWFIVTKDDQPITPSVAKQIGGLAGSAIVWLEIGPGSPWKDNDVRLKNGSLTPADLKNLAGRTESTKERALKLGTLLKKMADEAEDAHQKYQTALQVPNPSAFGFNGRLEGTAFATKSVSTVQSWGIMYKSQVIVLLQDLHIQRVDIHDADVAAQNVKDYTDVGTVGTLLLRIVKEIP